MRLLLLLMALMPLFLYAQQEKKISLGVKSGLNLANIFKAGRDEYFYKTSILQTGMSYSVR